MQTHNKIYFQFPIEIKGLKSIKKKKTKSHFYFLHEYIFYFQCKSYIIIYISLFHKCFFFIYISFLLHKQISISQVEKLGDFHSIRNRYARYSHKNTPRTQTKRYLNYLKTDNSRSRVTCE